VVESLPGTPLSGIRVAVLDMDLAGGYTDGAGNSAETLRPLMKVLNRLISADNGPYLAITWTSFPELVDDFKAMLIRDRPTALPISILRLEKSDFGTNEVYDAGKLMARLEAEVSGLWPFDLLLDWEAYASFASSEVTKQVTALAYAPHSKAPSVAPTAADYDAFVEAWRAHALAILHALTIASAGRNVDESSAVSALFDSLNPLHHDQLERFTSVANAGQREQGAKLKAVGGDPLPPEEVARLNRVLWFATAGAGGETAAPGDLFLLAKVATSIAGQGASFTHEDLVHDTFHGSALDGRENGKVLTDAKLGEKIAATCPVLLELTPACDYVQGSRKLARFVPGLLVLEGTRGILDVGNTQHLWRTKPFSTENDTGVPSPRCELVLDFHYSFAAGPRALGGAAPLLRMRAPVLVDVQANFGRHASRPGFLSVELTKKAPEVITAAPAPPGPTGVRLPTEPSSR
jgi:hypothetical protein